MDDSRQFSFVLRAQGQNETMIVRCRTLAFRAIRQLNERIVLQCTYIVNIMVIGYILQMYRYR